MTKSDRAIQKFGQSLDIKRNGGIIATEKGIIAEDKSIMDLSSNSCVEINDEVICNVTNKEYIIISVQPQIIKNKIESLLARF